jgi:hypothetical protein
LTPPFGLFPASGARTNVVTAIPEGIDCKHQCGASTHTDHFSYRR